MQLSSVANEMENVDAVLRIYAGSDVAETPGPDEFVAADYYVFGLDGLDWGGVWGDGKGGVSWRFSMLCTGEEEEDGLSLRVMPWR